MRILEKRRAGKWCNKENHCNYFAFYRENYMKGTNERAERRNFVLTFSSPSRSIARIAETLQSDPSGGVRGVSVVPIVTLCHSLPFPGLFVSHVSPSSITVVVVPLATVMRSALALAFDYSIHNNAVIPVPIKTGGYESSGVPVSVTTQY